MLQLNQHPNSKLVREIQITRTGFVICPISLDVFDTLKSQIENIENFLSKKGSCKIELPTNHVAYLISNVSQTYTGFNGTMIEKIEITRQMVAEALLDTTNIQPANILETRCSSDFNYLTNENWIALFPEGSLIPKNIPLFGVRAHAKFLPKKTKLPQCGRCFAWHNERSCARIPRCRLYSSTKLVENNHTICDPTRPHDCPPKCANCQGPHPVDSLECLICPRKDSTLPTKS